MNKPKHEYQYSILQYKHDLMTGEFLNVGLALFSQSANYFECQMINKYKRITATFPGADGEFIRKYLSHLQSSADGIKKYFDAIPDQHELVGKYPRNLTGLLEQILPYDDSSIYFGRPIDGVCEDPQLMFRNMFSRLVEIYLVEKNTQSRDDKDIWNKYKLEFKDNPVLEQLEHRKIQINNEQFEFNLTWKNGKVNILQPLSFDLQIPTNIRSKALQWYGTSMILGDSDEIGSLYYLLGAPDPNNIGQFKSYQEARDILSRKIDKYKVTIIEENEAEDFAKQIIPQMELDIDHNIPKD